MPTLRLVACASVPTYYICVYSTGALGQAPSFKISGFESSTMSDSSTSPLRLPILFSPSGNGPVATKKSRGCGEMTYDHGSILLLLYQVYHGVAALVGSMEASWAWVPRPSIRQLSLVWDGRQSITVFSMQRLSMGLEHRVRETHMLVSYQVGRAIGGTQNETPSWPIIQARTQDHTDGVILRHSHA